MLSFFKRKSSLNSPKKQGTCQSDTSKTDQIIVDVKKELQTLLDRQALLETQIKYLEGEARDRAEVQDKIGAIAALRKKKLFEKELVNNSSLISTLETEQITLEGGAIKKSAISVLKDIVEIKKQIQSEAPIEKIDDLIEDMNELREYEDELNDACSQLVDNSEFELDYNELLEQCKVKTSKVITTEPASVAKFEKL